MEGSQRRILSQWVTRSILDFENVTLPAERIDGSRTEMEEGRPVTRLLNNLGERKMMVSLTKEAVVEFRQVVKVCVF